MSRPPAARSSNGSKARRCPASRLSKPSASARLEPSAHPGLVAQPIGAERPFQLRFFPADEAVHQRKMERRQNERCRRTEQQCRAEENEHVAAEIERVPRKSIGPRRDERRLRLERDDPHATRIEMKRRPGAQQKPHDQEKPSGDSRQRTVEFADAEQRIEQRADPSDAETDDYDAGIVKDAFE